MTVGKCVLCGKIRKCSPKEIEHQSTISAPCSGRPSNRSYKEKAERLEAESGFGFRLCRPLA